MILFKRSLLSLNFNLLIKYRDKLLSTVLGLRSENERLKKMDEFNKSMILGVLSNMNDVSIICCSTKGFLLFVFI